MDNSRLGRKNLIRATGIASLILACGIALAAPCRSVTFDSAPWFTGGGYITSLAAADFNGDGYVDLVVGSGGNTSTFGRTPGLKIFLNDGHARFSNVMTVSETLFVRDVQAVDFDGDGAPDLIVTEEDTGTLLLLANRGNSFLEVGRYKGSGLPPVVGDFNGDGHLDIAMRAGSELLVLVGDGHGAFKSMTFAEPDGVAGLMRSGDIDGDGRDDLILTEPNARHLIIRHGSSSTVLGDPQPTVQFHENTDYFLVGDFDGSGKLDIVTRPGGLTVLEVLRDPGASASAAPVLQSFPGHGNSVVGDFTGDGVADFAVSQTPRSEITIGVLNSNPAFEALIPSQFALPNDLGNSMAAADFDGDGTLDLAVTNDTAVAILLNRGGGRFAAPPHIKATGVRAVVDLDGDGVNDLITDGNPIVGDVNPIVWFGNLDGSYRPSNILRPNARLYSLVEVADLNRDGNLDMVVVTPNPHFTGMGELWILLGHPGGSFTTTDLGSFGREPTSLSVVDLDGDGNLDIVIGNSPPESGKPVTIAYGRGDGTFEPPVDLEAASGGATMRVGDLNGDGLPDLIAGDPYGRSVILNLGHRTYQTTSTNDGILGPMQLADMNGDGKADLIDTFSHSAPYTLRQVDVNVRLGRGDGTFSPPLISKVAIDDATSLDVADMNGDGKPDIVINDYGTTASTNTFTVLFGKGTGEFETPLSWLSAGYLRIVDLNRDGRLDIMHDDVVRLNTCMDTAIRRRAVVH